MSAGASHPRSRAELLAESRAEVVELLRDEIIDAPDGRITFARFMSVALAHPTFGYYTTSESRAGFDGDFLTAPETDPIFGHTLARQIAECWERLGRPSPFMLREEGAGRGTLAVRVLEGLAREFPEMLDLLHVVLTDVDARRTSGAVERVRSAFLNVLVEHDTKQPGTGVLVANELLDAFPVHRLTLAGGELHEVYVAWEDGWFVDRIGPLSSADLAKTLEGIPLEEGQRLEVSPAAQKWASALGAKLTRGYALVIDYGYSGPELYAPERSSGTLKSYSKHLVSSEPYRRVGLQDLTAHVNFSAVSRAAQAGGCVELGLTTQAYFFAGLGIEQLLVALQHGQQADPYRYLNAREAVMHLMDPRGLGRFRVLVLGRDVPSSPPLRGLAFTLP